MSKEFTGESVEEPEEMRVHVVQAGDTLSSIVVAYYGAHNAVHWVELHGYNRAVIGENPNVLNVGMNLLIPPIEELLNPQPEARTHVVCPGENLSSIAVLYYGPEHAAHWITLYNYNRETIGENPDRLSAGVELVIPDLSQFLD